jgi:hypothetical protein
MINPSKSTVAKKGGNSQSSSSAFKTLLTNLLEVGGDTMKLNPKFTRPIKCAVKETYPNFVLHDGNFFVSAYFTPEAYESHYLKSKLSLTELQDFMIKINKWTLELSQVDSSKVFTSYASLEMRIVIHEFSVVSETRVSFEKANWPVNLYRDDDVRQHI